MRCTVALSVNIDLSRFVCLVSCVVMNAPIAVLHGVPNYPSMRFSPYPYFLFTAYVVMTETSEGGLKFEIKAS